MSVCERRSIDGMIELSWPGWGISGVYIFLGFFFFLLGFFFLVLLLLSFLVPMSNCLRLFVGWRIG